MDTRTFIEDNWASLTRTYFTQADDFYEQGGSINRMMIERLNLTMQDRNLDSSRPRVNYNGAWAQYDPFTDASLLQPLNLDQETPVEK